MGWLDGLRNLFALEPLHELQSNWSGMPSLETQLATVTAARTTTQATRPWRRASIADALGVPAIQRAVSLIANTTGSLTMQGYQNGAVSENPPRLIVRPDPYSTPQVFYRDSAYNMASRGEVIWWIGSRDTDGLPSALIVVPLAEVQVQPNVANRMLPIYQWGTPAAGMIEGTRWSPANPSGTFVHVTYLKEPGALRGMGPLQLCQAAISVSVEAQEWAANFYAEGGYPSIGIQKNGEWDETEALSFKAKWIATPNNEPHFYDDNIADIKEFSANPQGAQMLDARNYQNGDAARMFGIPGALLEFAQSGTSLTYQNIESVWTNFLRGCLQPNYLEPIETAMSDLIPRGWSSQFNVDGLLRADIKTRADVYNTLIPLNVMSIEQAQAAEGFASGNVEFAPVPFSPPSATPTRTLGGFRCLGVRSKRRNGIAHIETCGKLLSPGPTFVGMCPACHKVYPAA